MILVTFDPESSQVCKGLTLEMRTMGLAPLLRCVDSVEGVDEEVKAFLSENYTRVELDLGDGNVVNKLVKLTPHAGDYELLVAPVQRTLGGWSD